jgi:predicted AAA+ superfamily ATPase
MTLSESGHSNSAVSFSGLFTHDYDFKASPVKTDLHNIATYICRGGWPGAIDLDDNTAMRIPTQYIDTMLSSGASNKNRTQYMTRLLLKSLARNLGKAVKKKTLLADLQHGADDKESTVNRPTLEKLLDSLIDQFLIEEVFGWDAPVKSKSRVRISPVRSFVDPSIPASLLGMSPERLLMDMQTFGNLFEELCLRDIRVYASVMQDALPNPVLQYRDSDNLEVDVIVELRDGRWAALEIKLSENKVDAGIKNLTRLKEKVASNPLARTSAPSFMAVIVGKTDYCRRTQDGIYVIPITELTA